MTFQSLHEEIAKYYCIASSVHNFHNLFHLVHNKVQDEVNMWGKHMCLVEDKREHWTYKCVYEHTHVCSRTWNSFSPHQKNFIFNCSYCSCTIFLTSYLLFTQVLLISILNHVHYLQNYVFYFEKGLNSQMRSSSVSPTR